MAIQTNTRLESTETGVTNQAGVINANWQQLELIFNPANASHDYDGTAGDVGNLVRDNVYRDGAEALTDDGSVDIDFTKKPMKTLSTTQATTFTMSNVGAGKFVKLRIIDDGTGRGLTWPGSNFVWVTTALATTVASKVHIVELFSFDGTEVIAKAYSQP